MTELRVCTLGWEVADMVETHSPVLGSFFDDLKCGKEGCPCAMHDARCGEGVATAAGQEDLQREARIRKEQ